MAEDILSPIMSLPFECELGNENGQYMQEDVDPSEESDLLKRQKNSRKVIYEKRRVVIKEGFLLKHSKTTLKKGTYRNFKLYKDVLFYSRLKDETQSNRIEIVGASIAERGTRNTSHTFSVISETCTLILSAESRRDMEDWIRKLRSCAENRIEKEDLNVTQTLSGLHNWCLATHNRPIFCSKCKELLHGTNYKGVICEVCGINAHQNCANGIAQACKWTTRESMVRDGVKLEENSFDQPHQWQEGNLLTNSKCVLCKKQCGSKKSLQDWCCIWCRSCCHEGCRAKISDPCSLGKHGQLIVPATAAGEDTSELSWKILDTAYLSTPFLAYVNSRSGDNQGVKFVRRLRNMLNPLQVIDLGVKTPEPALDVYRVCERFYILACGGDGTVGWILQCLDKYDMHKKATTCVVPLGTGNDLSRVLGWGAACNDDLKLDGILEELRKCSIRNLDRWSVCQGPIMIPSLKRRSRVKAMENSPIPSRKMRSIAEKAEMTDSLLPKSEQLPRNLALRRRSSTGEIDLDKVIRINPLKSSISLLDLNLPVDEEPLSSEEVTFGFKDEFQASDKFEFTSTKPNVLISTSSINEDEVIDVEQELANEIVKVFRDITIGYPNPEKMNLLSAASLCSMFHVWVNNFLELMTKRLMPHDLEVNLTAKKVTTILAELPILINSIEKLNQKKVKCFLSENEILVRTGCFVLIAHSTDTKRLEGAGKSQFTSLLFGLLLKATQATDYRAFKGMMENSMKKSEVGTSEEAKRKKELAEIKDIATMNNYVGIGLDAKIALDFHNLREEHPEQCKTRGQNKMWYGIFTGRQMISQEFKTLSKRLILECDGEEIDLPQLQGIVLLNIPSYMAGTNFWGTDKESGAFNAPSIDDKKLEVIAVMGTTHMAESKMFGVQRHRLAQAETIKITIRGMQPVPIQVDGEAWLQNPGVVLIRHKNKAKMLVRDKKKNILQLSDPQIISRGFTQSQRGFGRSSSYTNLVLSDLIEALEGLLIALKSLIQSKKSEIQESVDKDLIVAFQKVSLTMLQVYGQDGLVISQGLHQKQGELIDSSKTILKETLLYLAISDTEGEHRNSIEEAQKSVVKVLKALVK